MIGTLSVHDEKIRNRVYNSYTGMNFRNFREEVVYIQEK
jgi:hypothetical protein